MIPPNAAREGATLRSARFRKEREADWRMLDALLRRAERGLGARLTDEEMVAIPRLYRAALSSLSAARATSLDRSLIDYLEALCARGYFFVYGARARFGERAQRFLARDWRQAVAALWPETLTAFLLLLLGAVAAASLVGSDADWFYAFVPAEYAAGRDPTASTAELASTLEGVQPGQAQGLGVFASYLFTHNAQVSLFAFALGFAFGAPTAALLFHNGLTIGALFAVFAARGLGVEFGGWLLIHGATELFAVTLAGAAGLRIGRALAFPGPMTRMDAAQAAGRQAALVMTGVVLMLLVAGLLEGYGRQLIADTAARYAIAIASLLAWCLFFYAPRPRPREPRHGAA